MQLVLETNQGLGIFHKSKPQKKTTLPYYGIKQDDDGDFFVMSGSETLQLAWTIYPTGVAKKEMKETFARFAEAVAYGEEDDLNDIHALVERILATEAGARDYRAKLEAEINSYARWTVKAIITNSGKEPVSLSPAAALYVGTQGQKYLDPQGVQSALEGDYRIEMTNTEESMTMGTKTGGGTMSLTPTPMLANSDTPIILPGGSAAAITFRSLGRVREIPDGPIVLDFYRKRNLKCVLLALPITSTPNTFGSPGLAWSEPIAFNEASFGQLFPKNAIW